MAMPARSSPVEARRLLSASSLLRNSSLDPLIASRGAGSKDPNVSSVASLRPYQGRYHNDRSSYLSTPRNMFDSEDLSPRIHGNKSTRVSGDDSIRYYNYSRQKLHGMHADPRQVDSKLVPVYYIAVPGDSRLEPAHARPRFRDYPAVLEPAPCCFVFLKLLQLALCLIIIVISRVGHGNLDLDITYTIFGVISLLVCGVSLFVICIRGHPAPGDCLHTTIFLCYAILVPMMLCGAILVLVQDSKNEYVGAMAGLFSAAIVVLTADVLLTCSTLLLCKWCSCDPYEQYPGHRASRVYPWSDRNDDDYPQHYHQRGHNDIRPQRYNYPAWKDPYYPRTLPQMRQEYRLIPVI